MKKMTSRLIIFLVILVFSSWSGSFSKMTYSPLGDGIIKVAAAEDIRVTTANLNLRSGPGTGYSVLTVMPRGGQVTVLSVSGSFAKINYSGREGYASTAYLTRAASASTMVTTANLNLRSGAGTSYRVLRVIPNGATVTVLSTSGGWARVTYSGTTGYASQSYLKTATPPPPPASTDIRITTEQLNLRSGPGTGYSIIASMPGGARITVHSVSGSWARVTYNGKTGYAHTAYMRKEGAVASSTVITKGQLGSKQIALTFDAGWEKDTTIPLLNMLDRYGLKATFYLRALWVRDNLSLAKEIQKRGHSIQNHSLTHPHMKTMTESEIRYEFVQSTKIFKDLLGITPNQFRPPFGEYDARVLKIAGEEGYRYTVMWSIDTVDWAETHNGKTVTKDYITDRVLNNVTDRDIVLMHIAFQKTVDALPRMIETLRSRGFTFRTVPQMVQ